MDWNLDMLEVYSLKTEHVERICNVDQFLILFQITWKMS